MQNTKKILISACLAGVNCKYDGTNNANPKIIELINSGNAILVCPEQLGGLSTPRTPSERANTKVLSQNGKDVTQEFQKGAEETLKIAQRFHIKKAILKSKSPSCGSNYIYDGTFSHTLTNRDGVTAELLKANGIEVISSDELN